MQEQGHFKVKLEGQGHLKVHFQEQGHFKVIRRDKVNSRSKVKVKVISRSKSVNKALGCEQWPLACGSPQTDTQMLHGLERQSQSEPVLRKLSHCTSCPMLTHYNIEVSHPLWASCWYHFISNSIDFKSTTSARLSTHIIHNGNRHTFPQTWGKQTDVRYQVHYFPALPKLPGW